MCSDNGKIKNERSNIYKTVLGKWITNIGNILFDYINCSTLAAINSRSSLLVAIYKASENIIKLLVGIIAGTFADNLADKKKALIITDVLSGIICIVLSFFVKGALIPYIIITCNALLAIIEVINMPLYKAMIRETIFKNNIIKLNSILTGGTEVISIVTPILGIFILHFAGIRIGLFINGLTFILAAIIEMFLVIINAQPIVKTENLLLGIVNGFDYIKKSENILKLLISVGTINFFMAGYEFYLPYADTIFFTPGKDTYAIIISTQGIAAILGSIFSIKFGRIFRRNIKKIQGICILIGFSIFLMMFYRKDGMSFLFPVIMLSIIAFLSTIYNVQYMSYIQETVDVSYMGRVLSLVKTIALILVPAGTLLSSLIFKMNFRLSVVFSGLGIIIVGIISTICMKNDR